MRTLNHCIRKSLIQTLLLALALFTPLGSLEADGKTAQINTATQASPEKAGKQQLKGYRRPEFASAPLVGAMESAAIMNLAIALPARDRAALDKLAQEVSDPQSPQYRQFLTPAQMVERFSPPEADYAAVAQFARAQGFRVVRTYTNRYLLDVSGTVETVEGALHIKINNYRRPDGTIFFAPDREPSLDLDVAVLYIAGLENYVLPRHMAAPAPYLGGGPLNSLVSQDFRNLYAGNSTLMGQGQTVGLLEFAAPNDTDIHGNGTTLSGYAGTVNPPAGVTAWPQFLLWPPGTQQPSLNNLSPLEQGEIGEAELDVEMAMGMAPGLDNIVVYVATLQPASNLSGQLANAAIIDSALNAMLSPPSGYPLSLQLSASLNWVVDDFTQQALTSMAGQGQSFFVVSGDLGFYSSASGCVSPPTSQISSGLYSANDLVLGFTTVVGGTLWAAPPYGEIAWNSTIPWSSTEAGLASGGGVAGAGIPSYQSAIASGSAASASGASANSRNLPDVAAVAGNVFAYITGNRAVTGGTSAASPLWAGFMALANQQRQQQNPGVGGMGFLNPTLYAIASSPQAYATDFHDITYGNNSTPTCTGANAEPGYDLVTGLGSPTGQLINDLGTGISIAVTPAVVSPHSPVAQLNWWSLNGKACAAATTCINVASGQACPRVSASWSGSQPANGQMSVTAPQTVGALRGTAYTYSLTCKAPNGKIIQASAHLKVQPLCEVNGTPCPE